MSDNTLRAELVKLIRDAAQLAEDTTCKDDITSLSDCPSCSMPINICAIVSGVITTVYADVEPLVEMLLAHLQLRSEYRYSSHTTIERRLTGDWKKV